MSQTIIMRNLGRQPYEAVWGAMKEFTDQRGSETVDELWVVEHDPVFTQGLAGKAEHVLNPGRIPIVQSDRGGQVTYHGPGQVVIYPLLDLNRSGLGVRCLVNRLEQAVIDMLAEAGVQASRRDSAPGVYVNQAKIASIGLKVRRGCTYHGLAFNVAMDLTPFSLINPCGFSGLPMTQLSELVPGATWDGAENQLSTAICQCLGYYPVVGQAPELPAIASDRVIP